MSQDRAAVEAEIRKLVSEIVEIPEDEIPPRAHFVDDLGADSMSALELMSKIERRFKIVVHPENMPRMRTLASVTDLVVELAAKKNA